MIIQRTNIKQTFFNLSKVLNYLYFGIIGKSIFQKNKFPFYKEYFYHKEIPFPSKICKAPFNNLYFQADGQISACCYNRIIATEYSKQKEIKEIWNSEKRNNLRKAIINFDLTNGCHQCHDILATSSFSNVLANTFDKLPVNKHFPTSMEFELSKRCNLECVMCSDKLSRFMLDTESENDMIYDSAFLDQLKPFIPHLKQAKFIGGEPFVIDIYYKIWELIISMNPNCRIGIQTNGTVLNSKIKTILEKGKFNIGISIDSVNKETYESIRKRAKFDVVMKNLEYFQDYCHRKRTGFGISTCYMQQNWKEIPDIIEFCNKRNIPIYFNRVISPYSASLKYMTYNELHTVYQFFCRYKSDTFSLIARKNKEQFSGIINQVFSWKEQVKKDETILGAINSLSLPEIENKIIEKFDAVNFQQLNSDKEKVVLRIKRLFNKYQNNSNYKKIIYRIYLIEPIKLAKVLADFSEDQMNEKLSHMLDL